MAKCICRRCERVFSGLSLFDEHFSGRRTQIGPDYGRRCMTDAEMIGNGWRLIDGMWRGVEMPPEMVRARFARGEISTQSDKALQG